MYYLVTCYVRIGGNYIRNCCLKSTQDRSIFFLAIGIAVGISVMLMMALKITHPPAGGNAIVVMLTQDSFQFLIFPIMVGASYYYNWRGDLQSLYFKKKISSEMVIV